MEEKIENTPGQAERSAGQEPMNKSDENGKGSKYLFLFPLVIIILLCVGFAQLRSDIRPSSDSDLPTGGHGDFGSKKEPSINDKLVDGFL